MFSKVGKNKASVRKFIVNASCSEEMKFLKQKEVFGYYSMYFRLLFCLSKNVWAFHLKRQGVLVEMPKRFIFDAYRSIRALFDELLPDNPKTDFAF